MRVSLRLPVHIHYECFAKRGFCLQRALAGRLCMSLRPWLPLACLRPQFWLIVFSGRPSWTLCCSFLLSGGLCRPPRRPLMTLRPWFRCLSSGAPRTPCSRLYNSKRVYSPLLALPLPCRRMAPPMTSYGSCGRLIRTPHSWNPRKAWFIGAQKRWQQTNLSSNPRVLSQAIHFRMPSRGVLY